MAENKELHQEEEMEQVQVVVNHNAETGTTDIVGTLDEASLDSYTDKEELFNNLSDSIEDVDIDEDAELDNSPVTDEEFADYMNNSDSVITEMTKDNKMPDISIESTKVLLDVVNRKLAGEKFNPYKEFPDEIRSIIDKYVTAGAIGIHNQPVNINAIKKQVAEALLDDFINDIQMNRLKNDFASDLENLYKDSIKDIAAGTIEYIDERNKAYREAVDNIEDEEKKAKMLGLIDQIDEARSLSSLKEFAKHCKIKPIELEKPNNRVYDSFLYKYKNSTNNIYDINLAKKVLFRHLGQDGYSIKDIDAFLIAFCKQVKNYSSAKPIEHVYMYYVLYYCALLDGDNSEVFKNNVKEVIDSLKERNSTVLK